MTDHHDEPLIPAVDPAYVDELIAIDEDDGDIDAEPAKNLRRFLIVVGALAALAILSAIAGASIAGFQIGQQGVDFSEKAERRSVCSILNQAANNELERAAAALQAEESDLERQSAALDRAVALETSLFVEGLQIVVTDGDDDPRLAQIIVELDGARLEAAAQARAVDEQEDAVRDAEDLVDEKSDALAISDTYTQDRITRINSGENVRCTAQS